MNAIMSAGEYFFGFLLGCVTLCITVIAGGLFALVDVGRYLRISRM